MIGFFVTILNGQELCFFKPCRFKQSSRSVEREIKREQPVLPHWALLTFVPYFLAKSRIVCYTVG